VRRFESCWGRFPELAKSPLTCGFADLTLERLCSRRPL